MLIELSRIVKEVGGKLVEWRNSSASLGKWEGSQFKAQADLLAHEALVKELNLLAPDIPVISEEDSLSWSRNRPSRYWLIDPIDGTASFAHGYSGFVTQVALIKQESPYLAAVYAPALDALYLAERNRGAFLNGHRLHCALKSPTKTLIDNYPEPRGVTRLAYKALGFRHYIECGSISLKICKIADGSADLFFKNVIVRDWDLAAPQVILEEAGGLLTDIRGNHINYIGNYEQLGVVAAPEREMSKRLVSWYAKFDKIE